MSKEGVRIAREQPSGSGRSGFDRNGGKRSALPAGPAQAASGARPLPLPSYPPSPAVRILVTGAGGFIGHHLVSSLKRHGHWVRGVDLKYPEFGETAADEFLCLDLRDADSARAAAEGIEEMFALAADMGGMGYISVNHAGILQNNLLINLRAMEAAVASGVRRYLFTSSACIYPEYRQTRPNATALKEEDAYPAQPQDAYGWEKLVTERLCWHYREQFGLETRVARFHNIFGPFGTWRGGREKAPAAICRKVATAKLTGNLEVEIWGDGEQTRSFCYVDDCVVGLQRLMQSDHPEPLNLGQDRMVTINQLVRMVAEIAETDVVIRHVEGPQGVRGRNSDNTKLRQVLGWEPQIALEEGLAETYRWIEDQVRMSLADRWADVQRPAAVATSTGAAPLHADR